MTNSAFEGDIPEGSCLLPINCSRIRSKTTYRGRPLLVLIDSERREELEPYHWVTSHSPREADASPVFRLVPAPGRLGRAGYPLTFRERLASRVLGIHTEVDDAVAYRNGDRLDCRAVNLIRKRDSRPCGVDPRRVVPAGSTFTHTPSYAAAYAERMKNWETLSRKHPPGRRPALTPEQIRAVLETIRDQPWAQGRPYTWFRDEFFAMPDCPWTGAKLPVSSIRAILKGEQQRLRDFDYSTVAPFLSDRVSRRAKLIGDVYGKE
jgi:hypothetical protein